MLPVKNAESLKQLRWLFMVQAIVNLWNAYPQDITPNHCDWHRSQGWGETLKQSNLTVLKTCHSKSLEEAFDKRSLTTDERCSCPGLKH